MHNTPKDILTMKKKPTPYAQRSTSNLLFLKALLEQEGILVPTDLLSALSSKGVIV